MEREKERQKYLTDTAARYAAIEAAVAVMLIPVSAKYFFGPSVRVVGLWG